MAAQLVHALKSILAACGVGDEAEAEEEDEEEA